MSILKTMYSAASGLLAHAEAISVASDNIANVNTVGFKSQRARFEDVLGSTVAGAVDNQTSGQGVRLGGVHTIWTQGSMIGSRNNTDMAIQGDGFFVVQGAFDGVQNGKFYSRDGQFNIDNEGMLVNTAGLQVQGYVADQDENISSTLSSLEIPLTKIVPPKQTDEIVIGANLSPQPSSAFIA
ncbi:MAG: flagellar hook-basal body complex protein, partial [Myxococcota bacterium]|nr:flagellar hook-basal body complex protein [Myxococcota bacterium]